MGSCITGSIRVPIRTYQDSIKGLRATSWSSLQLSKGRGIQTLDLLNPKPSFVGRSRAEFQGPFVKKIGLEHRQVGKLFGAAFGFECCYFSFGSSLAACSKTPGNHKLHSYGSVVLDRLGQLQLPRSSTLHPLRVCISYVCVCVCVFVRM